MKRTPAQLAVDKHVRSLLTPEIERLSRLAYWDLWHGPIANDGEQGPDDGHPWPGFSEACKQVSAALDTLGDLWVDTDSDSISDSEPEGYTDDDTGEFVEPYLDSTYHFTRKEALHATFLELAEYL